MCYLLRVHGILFHSKFILLCMFEKKKKERKKREKKIHDLRIESIIKHKNNMNK